MTGHTRVFRRLFVMPVAAVLLLHGSVRASVMPNVVLPRLSWVLSVSCNIVL